MLSNSIQQLLLVIRNGRQEVHVRTLTSVCKSGIRYGNSVFAKFIQYLYAICFTGCRIKRSHMLFVGKLQNFKNCYTQAADIRRTFRLCTNLGEITQLKLTTGRKWLMKQQILMYKTAVNTLVNGVITHQK